MAMWYWSVANLFWQLSIDHIVNGQYKRHGFSKTHLRHPSLPFDSLPYPTRTICRRVRTYERSVSHVTTKRKEVDCILWVWGSVQRALRARGSPAINVITLSTFYVISHANGPFPSSLHTGQSPLSHFRDLNGSDLWSNFLIATPAFSTTLILKPCR